MNNLLGDIKRVCFLLSNETTKEIEVVVCVNRKFLLSDAAISLFKQYENQEIQDDGSYPGTENKVLRTNTNLIRVINELGEKAGKEDRWSNQNSAFRVISVPDTACYVPFPYSESVYDTLDEAISGIVDYDHELDIFRFKTNGLVKIDNRGKITCDTDNGIDTMFDDQTDDDDEPEN